MQVSVKFGQIIISMQIRRCIFDNLTNFENAQAYLSIRQLRCRCAATHAQSAVRFWKPMARITIQSLLQAIHALIRVNIYAG